jgi:hypothetical protein
LLTAAGSAQTAQPDGEQKAGADQECAVVFCSGVIVNQALPQVTAAFDNRAEEKPSANLST